MAYNQEIKCEDKVSIEDIFILVFLSNNSNGEAIRVVLVV